MNPVRLAVAELRRLTSSRLARLALAALVLIPTLYGGLYLYANHDPYGAFPQVPAAVVSDDTGTTLSTGEKLQVGGQVADHLVESKSFDWHRVSHAEAMSGVDDGTYAFAVILPAPSRPTSRRRPSSSPRQATVVLETNDANNYMTSMIGNQVIKQVTASVASEVSQTAASRLLLGFSQVHDQLVKAVDGSEQLRAGAAKADSGAHQLATGATGLAARPSRPVVRRQAPRHRRRPGGLRCRQPRSRSRAARVGAGHAAVAHGDSAVPDRHAGRRCRAGRGRQPRPSPATAPGPRQPPPTSGSASPPTAPRSSTPCAPRGYRRTALGRRVAPRHHRRLRRPGRRDDPVGVERPDAPVEGGRPGGHRRAGARERHPGPDRRHRAGPFGGGAGA